ncbi:uncharacterized protein LOC136072218 [Hydra vulgaris]|uniref:uncharacterized protein LOC136072218 n=1 Tax=Hydra vulgaris TaxID=6087 RepID=UPI0032EA8E01
MSINDPTGRLARWSLILQSYNFKIEYRSGNVHGNADGLSRRNYDTVATLTVPGKTIDQVVKEQRTDPFYANLVIYLVKKELPEDLKEAKKGLTKKLTSFWHGPFRLIEKTSPVTFKVENMNNKELLTPIYVSRFKQWFGYQEKPITDLALSTEVRTKATETMDEFCFEETNHKIQKEVNLAPEIEHQVDRMENLDSDIYKMEKIIKKRTRGRKIQYLIKWEGYPSSQNTWEPEENIFDPQVIQIINSKKTSKSVHISAITTTNLRIRKKKKETNSRVMLKVTLRVNKLWKLWCLAL